MMRPVTEHTRKAPSIKSIHDAWLRKDRMCPDLYFFTKCRNQISRFVLTISELWELHPEEGK